MRISPHTHTLISNTYRERSRPTERLISVHTQTHTPESSSGDSLTHSLWCSLGEVAGPALLLAKLQGGPTPSLSSSLLPLLFSCQLQRSSATLSLLCHFLFLSLHVFFLLFFLLSCHFFFTFILYFAHIFFDFSSYYYTRLLFHHSRGFSTAPLTPVLHLSFFNANSPHPFLPSSKLFLLSLILIILLSWTLVSLPTLGLSLNQLFWHLISIV